MKLIFFLHFFFLFLLEYNGGYNSNKTRPGDHKSNFKNVHSIPCGFNTMEYSFVPCIKQYKALKISSCTIYMY